ncbi:2007_t:CDS:1, partial [Dentiscutata heterogama]
KMSKFKDRRILQPVNNSHMRAFTNKAILKLEQCLFSTHIPYIKTLSGGHAT